ncbi:hypothetical protein B0H10DRAFT_2218132 [Mycena sp. CBHHK59/15]|nr:hypothetical protein B0H10DRAFT_2218132 [Mycena sp. CBHHK59/15]
MNPEAWVARWNFPPSPLQTVHSANGSCDDEAIRNCIYQHWVSAIRRLARRGRGVKRISGLIHEETRTVLKIFLEKVIRDSVTYTEHAKIVLKRSGRTLYGFGA